MAEADGTSKRAQEVTGPDPPLSTSEDIARKRSVLLSARIRFSPETQPVRETAINKIVEQNLLVADREGGITVREIEQQGALCFADGAPAIGRAEIEKALGRLVADRRLEVAGSKYRLAEQVRTELWEWQRSTEHRFARVVSRLFVNAAIDSPRYAVPFLHCLCIIFSGLGETYVRLIKGEAGPSDLLHLPLVLRALRETKARYPFVDSDTFDAAITPFFRDADPDYDAIKWNLAQNYYIAKALGLDPGGYLLSREVFGNAVFYLDTNVVINALEPIARHHASFKALSAACKKLGIELRVCHVSLTELKGVVESQRDLLEKVTSRIPEATGPKVRGLFYELYRERRKQGGEVNLDELFAAFRSPLPTLSDAFGVDLVDDKWFVGAEHDGRTTALVERIRREYKERRGRPKARVSAIHDALLLQWVQLERESSGRNCWVVTLDLSLPAFCPDRGSNRERPLAITLDALLQWITPLAVGVEDEDAVASVFAEALKYQLLPQENFFDLRDFVIFAEMEWATKELPAEDVEACIRYLRVQGQDLDPSSPADREKMGREIAKFFADPGRKFKEEVSRLEAKLSQVEQRARHTSETDREAIRARDERIASLERERTEDAEKKRVGKLRISAYGRLAVVALAFLLAEGGAAYVAHVFGTGKNLLEKVVSLWHLLSLGPVLSGGLLWWLLDKERIRALGGPFTKWLKDGE